MLLRPAESQVNTDVYILYCDSTACCATVAYRKQPCPNDNKLLLVQPAQNAQPVTQLSIKYCVIRKCAAGTAV